MPDSHDTGKNLDRLIEQIPGQHAKIVSRVRDARKPTGVWSRKSGAEVMADARKHCQRTGAVAKDYEGRLTVAHLLAYLQSGAVMRELALT